MAKTKGVLGKNRISSIFERILLQILTEESMISPIRAKLKNEIARFIFSIAMSAAARLRDCISQVWFINIRTMIIVNHNCLD